MFGIIDIVALVVEMTSEFLSLLWAIGQICDGFYHDGFKVFFAPWSAGCSDNRKVFR